MDNKRRNFLKATGALLASSSLPMLSMFPAKAQAAITPNPKKLVVLLLQGGNDGMNTVIPTNDEQYAHYTTLRPDIGIVHRVGLKVHDLIPPGESRPHSLVDF